MSMTLDRNNRTDSGGKLTGWHVLAMLVTFFGVMFVANGFLVYYALGTFSGVVTDSSYQASQHYNLDIAAARAQQLRNWQVAAEAKRDADGLVAVRINARDADGNPISGVDFRATLQRPTSRQEDRPVDLTPSVGEAGVYTGTARNVPLGQWELVIDADTANSSQAIADQHDARAAEGAAPHLFESESRIIFR
jgi:nitrogen fixation protein FixH